MSVLNWFPAYLALGAFAGFFAGLLGIGGGLIMVPILAMIFSAQAEFQPALVLPIALGTSIAAINFTSLASIRTHHQHGAVLWPVVAGITPGILLGTAAGSLVAASVPVKMLGFIFTGFVCLIAAQMAFNLKPKPTRTLPGTLAIAATGFGIGAISALVAIGGGSMTVPFLTWCNVRVHNAIGTSAAVGLPIALGGTVGYIANGLATPALPAGNLGFVHLPALAGIVLASMLTAPLGARTAHRMPISLLRRLFAVMLMLMAFKMLWGLWSSPAV